MPESTSVLLKLIDFVLVWMKCKCDTIQATRKYMYLTLLPKIPLILNLGFPILFISKIDEATSKTEQKKNISKKPLPVTTSKYMYNCVHKDYS